MSDLSIIVTVASIIREDEDCGPIRAAQARRLSEKIVSELSLDLAFAVVGAGLHWAWWERVAAKYRLEWPMSALNAEYYAPNVTAARKLLENALEAYSRGSSEREADAA